MIFNRFKKNGLSSGQRAEATALKYLKQHSLRYITKNYSCRAGEIDLIMEDGEVLVFVEVRYRKHSTHGTAAETITASKQNKIRATAQNYMLTNKIGELQTLRFDVVVIDNDNISWIKNAF